MTLNCLKQYGNTDLPHSLVKIHMLKREGKQRGVFVYNCINNVATCTLHATCSFSSVQLLSHVWLLATPWTTARQASLSITNPCPLSRWWHPTISSSVIPFSSCPQSFPASGSFPMSQLFASGGQSIGVSASTSVLPMDTRVWSPLGWTSWISLQSKGLLN